MVPVVPDADGRVVEMLPSIPGLGGLYAKGAAASGRIAADRITGGSLPWLGSGAAEHDGPLTVPAVAYRVAEVRTDALAGRLRDYQRLLHEPNSDLLPAGYLHVLAFPLATAVMVRADFPLPLLGMVHLANDVSLLRPVRLGDVLEVTAWAQALRPHRRGVQVDLVAEVKVAGELAWRGVSTYLAKGFTAPGAAGEPEPAPIDLLRDGDTGTADHSVWAPPLPTGRWVLSAGVGRAYGAISGDRNPIHLSALSAKAFGFPRAIAHGMYTASRALAAVGPQRGDAYRWQVEFAKPVLLPGTVDVSVVPSPDGEGFAYDGWNPKRSIHHFTGSVTPLA